MTHYYRPARTALLPGWIVFLALTPSYTLGAPVAGEFIAGSGSISQAGATTTITQTSQQASLNWQGFNIAQHETVRFVQPSATAIAVNRIFDTNGSQLLGQLQANGQVWLINPNGVLFGAGAQVNVGGLLASTLDVQDTALNSSTRSVSGNGKGSVINQSLIKTADGGYVALLGNQVSNQGTIIARLGTVALGAGSAVTLNFNGNKLISLQVDKSVLQSVAENGGLIRADGGQVRMSAGAHDSLLASVINNNGIIEAHTVSEQSGSIILLGGMQAGSVQVRGTLDASAPDGGQGGFIETSAAQVQIGQTARISTASTKGIAGKWLVDPQNFTVATSGGDISAATLSTALDNTSIELQSHQGSSAGGGNIHINAAISWSADTTLTLTASNNVNVNASLTATGANASLVINPNTANGSEPASGSGLFALQSGASITLSGNHPSLSIAGVSYTVINQFDALQNMSVDPGAHYALGSNIDASASALLNDGRGFTPIGDLGTPFTGTLHGLGHSISHLSIDRLTTGPVSENVGLIGAAGDGSVIQHIGITDGRIKGGAGTGGLVGSNTTGTISNSYFTGTVTGGAGTGGLVGSTVSGSILNSYSIGDITGGAGTGGLVGSATSGSVASSYSIGEVVGAAGTGGLVGSVTSGNVSQSYHTGNVTGQAGSGGLVGSITSGSVSQSYHTGNVTGAAGSGGLVGSITSGSIDNSYSKGNVVGAAGTGGLAGSVTSGTVSNTYAVGTVTGAAGTGGLLGATSGPVLSSYWDNTVGPASSVGGATGFGSAQMMDKNNFADWDFTSVWIALPGNTMLLQSVMKQVNVTANSFSKTYDGFAFSGGNGVSYSSLPDGTLPTGITFSGSAQGAVNVAGSPYVITPGGLVSNQAVHYNFIDGLLTINPFAVSLTGTRTYNGSLDMLASAMTIGSLVGTETLTLSSIGTLASKDAGKLKTVGIGTLALNNSGSSLAGNYSFTGASQTATITQAALTLTSSAVSKTYDGGLSALGTATLSSGSVMSGDSLTGGSFAFTDKNVGSGNKTVSTTGVTVGDGTHNSNYLISYADNTASTITRANLVIYDVVANNKVADGTRTASLGGTADVDALGSDVITVGGTGVGKFSDALVGNNKTVTVTGFTLIGADTSNYNFSQPVGLFANITASGSEPVFITPQVVSDMITQLTAETCVFETAPPIQKMKRNCAGKKGAAPITPTAKSSFLSSQGVKLPVNMMSLHE